MKYTVEFTSSGYLQIRLEPYFVLLEEAISADLMTVQNQEWLLEALRNVLRGKETYQEFTGNSYTFEIEKEETLLLDEEDDTRVLRIPTDELHDVILFWYEYTKRMEQS